MEAEAARRGAGAGQVHNVPWPAALTLTGTGGMVHAKAGGAVNSFPDRFEVSLSDGENFECRTKKVEPSNVPDWEFRVVADVSYAFTKQDIFQVRGPHGETWVGQVEMVIGRTPHVLEVTFLAVAQTAPSAAVDDTAHALSGGLVR